MMGAEDWSYVLQRVPGAMAFLGACPPGLDPEKAPANHSNRVVFDEDAMAVGVATHVAVALAALNGWPHAPDQPPDRRVRDAPRCRRDALPELPEVESAAPSSPGPRSAGASPTMDDSDTFVCRAARARRDPVRPPRGGR